MTNKIFGELNYDFIWEGETKINLFNEEYKIKLGIDDEDEVGISSIQEETFTYFKNNEKVICEKIEETIYNYYCKICKDEPEKIDADVIGDLQEAKSPIEMKRLVKPIKMCIPELEDDREIEILFDCKWDFESGLGVRIVNEEIVKIGTQNDVLI